MNRIFINRTLPALLPALLCATALPAAELGDPAPPLQIQEWIKGGPVDLSQGQGKNIYVIEFWATWCPPCRTSIPHLSDLQKKFKDQRVVFLGVSAEKAEVVKKFVTQLGDKMDYVVALDDDNQTSANYMGAFGINGIPHAFVVDQEGRIVWHGHPMDKLGETVQSVVDGKFDLTKTKQRAAAEVKLQRFVELTSAGDDAAAQKLEPELAALDKELGGLRDGKEFDPADLRQQIKFSQLFKKYQSLALRGGDPDEIAKLEKDLEAAAPKDFKLAEFKADMKKMTERTAAAQKSKALVNGYFAAVGKDGDPAKAAVLAQQIEALGASAAQMFNDIAWTILTDDAVQTRDLKLALKLAQRANAATEDKEAGILDTYARALFDNGQTSAAVAQEKKAIALTEDNEAKAEMKKTLAKYEATARESAPPEAK